MRESKSASARISWDFRDHYCVVTGGGAGIGRAIAAAFASAGARVIIADIDEAAGLDAVDELGALGGEVRFFRADVSREEEVRALFDACARWGGSLHILINNAGIGLPPTPIVELDVASWERVLGVNLRGPFLCVKYAVPLMRAAGGGHVVNIASTRALMSEPHTESYAASKGAILALTHALAISLGPEGIRVNAISPGWIETAEWRRRGERSTPQHSERDRLQHPVGRVGTPSDMAQAALFLCADAAGFITGANLVIDGGMTVKMIYE